MLNRPLTLLLIGAGFAGGMTLAMSCNMGRSASTHEAYAQDKGEKKDAKAEKDEDGEEDDEAPIKLADAPEPVRAAILKLTPEKSIKKIIREGDELAIFTAVSGG